MQLTPLEVKKIAILARLSLSEEETQSYADQLTAIFGYVEMLNEVDTEGVEETCQVTGLQDVVREDVVVDCNDEVKKELVKAFSDKKGNLLQVKGVFISE
jgi:aspartyl-tRNA(Asn)/glutamyl-tRNA(Gln) amidotransferase subunit C